MTGTHNRRTIQSRDATVQLIWESVPVEIRRAFMPYAEWLCEYAPRWCTCVIVEHDPKDTSAPVKVVTEREYNTVRLLVLCGWTAEAVPARCEKIVHELVHVYAASLCEYQEDLEAVEWKDNEALRAARSQQYHHADESFTEDMARLLVKLLPKPNLRHVDDDATLHLPGEPPGADD